MHIHGFLVRGKNFQGILFYKQEEGILSLGFACHDLHNPPKISNWLEEGIHHSQKALKDLNIDHVYHLDVKKKYGQIHSQSIFFN